MTKAKLPDTPTPEMLVAGARAIGQTITHPNHAERAAIVWRAMIAAFRTGALPPNTSAESESPHIGPIRGPPD